MENECILCGRFVELVNDRDVWTLQQVGDDQKEFVCDRCINKKLNFGEPVGTCLYCEREVDYKLHRMGVTSSHSGPAIFSRGDTKPMLCQDHFDELIEDDIDHTLDIEKVLTEVPKLNRPSSDPKELIGDEEGTYLEYKETLLWDIYQEQANTELREEVVKEVCALANSEGGLIIIGVEDDTKDVVGLSRDYRLMRNSRDDFELQLNQEIVDKIGETFAANCVDIQFQDINGRDICAVEIDPSRSPVFFAEDEFYIRVGSSSRPLTMQEAHSYIQEHW